MNKKRTCFKKNYKNEISALTTKKRIDKNKDLMVRKKLNTLVDRKKQRLKNFYLHKIKTFVDGKTTRNK